MRSIFGCSRVTHLWVGAVTFWRVRNAAVAASRHLSMTACTPAFISVAATPWLIS